MPCSCLAVKQEVGLLSNQELLLQVLMDLTPPELSRFQWLLTRKVLHNFAPIPPHWLSSADAWKTTETLLRCYQEDGALRLAAEILRMMGCADQVDELCNRCCRTPVPSWPATNPKPRANCVEALRRQLIDGMQHAADVLDALHAHGLLGEAETEAISIYAARRDKNRALVDMVLRKGARAQQMFYQALSQSEPFLLEELDSISKVCEEVNPARRGHVRMSSCHS
uniref:CARD domain-containing protein n=1 Tax=Myripristis murdjan TaxID=586833 RepID=A0A667Z2I2_9TELE